MKNIGIVVICAFVGGAMGFILGMGELNYVKKSQREAVFPALAFVGVVIGIVGGIKLATVINKEEKDDAKYGTSEMKTFEGKEGRKWYRLTTWINPETGIENVIITQYLDGSVCTFLNGERIINHRTTSGAKKDIERLHQSSVYQITKQIKQGQINLR